VRRNTSSARRHGLLELGQLAVDPHQLPGERILEVGLQRQDLQLDLFCLLGGARDRGLVGGDLGLELRAQAAQRQQLGLADEVLFQQLGLVGDLLGHDVELLAQALVLALDRGDLLVELADAPAEDRLALRQGLALDGELGLLVDEEGLVVGIGDRGERGGKGELGCVALERLQPEPLGLEAVPLALPGGEAGQRLHRRQAHQQIALRAPGRPR
jgi:hypothetical protein